jgi:phosphatidylethanolamine N-methyltransferase
LMKAHKVHSRVADDISSYDTSKYKIAIVPSNTSNTLRFHLGEPIRVNWKAPSHHSRRDWIGIYRVCNGSLSYPL